MERREAVESGAAQGQLCTREAAAPTGRFVSERAG